jgi:hypothetical protein
MTKKIEETIVKPSEHKFLKEKINNCKETLRYYHWGVGFDAYHWKLKPQWAHWNNSKEQGRSSIAAA